VPPHPRCKNKDAPRVGHPAEFRYSPKINTQITYPRRIAW
jgi:hypothetical protein